MQRTTTACLALVSLFGTAIGQTDSAPDRAAPTTPQIEKLGPSKYRIGMVTVEKVHAGTPADGKFAKGDVILEVNGAKLEGRNPLVVLGSALTAAEAKDGALLFVVKPATGGDPKQVKVTVPVLGAYSEIFPLNCLESRKIIRRAADFYGGKDRLKGHGFLNGPACLFLLSAGEKTDVPRVKEYFSQFLKPDGTVTGIAMMDLCVEVLRKRELGLTPPPPTLETANPSSPALPTAP